MLSPDTSEQSRVGPEGLLKDYPMPGRRCRATTFTAVSCMRVAFRVTTGTLIPKNARFNLASISSGTFGEIVVVSVVVAATTTTTTIAAAATLAVVIAARAGVDHTLVRITEGATRLRLVRAKRWRHGNRRAGFNCLLRRLGKGMWRRKKCGTAGGVSSLSSLPSRPGRGPGNPLRPTRSLHGSRPADCADNHRERRNGPHGELRNVVSSRRHCL